MNYCEAARSICRSNQLHSWNATTPTMAATNKVPSMVSISVQFSSVFGYNPHRNRRQLMWSMAIQMICHICTGVAFSQSQRHHHPTANKAVAELRRDMRTYCQQHEAGMHRQAHAGLTLSLKIIYAESTSTCFNHRRLHNQISR